ncbi:unnamed protein product [Linum tenue]|uniref:Uncharacterized protein n=1 Tax=Linum tenue TaxID=586396 RepID=A0AAV0P6A0_9ROSI|nr:unnamed protein product [Linum tenue]
MVSDDESSRDAHGGVIPIEGGEKVLTWVWMNRANEVDGDSFAEKLVNSIEERSFDVVQVQHVLLHQHNRPHDLVAAAAAVVVAATGAAILGYGDISGLHTATFHDFLQHFFTLLGLEGRKENRGKEGRKEDSKSEF